MRLIAPTLIFMGLYCIIELIFNQKQELIPFLVGMFVASVSLSLALYFIIRCRRKQMIKGAKLFNEKVVCVDLITYKKGVLYIADFCYLLESKLVFKTGIFSIQNLLFLPMSDITSIFTRKIGFNKILINILSKTENSISFIISSDSDLLTAIKQNVKVE